LNGFIIRVCHSHPQSNARRSSFPDLVE
jgi:hypothetical protein